MKWLKNSVGKGFMFHVIFSAHYCIVFSENIKEPSHFNMLESKLWPKKNRNQKFKGCTDGGIYQNL